MVLLDKNNFQSEVLDTKGYVLVDYFGDGCVPCQALMPDIEELEKKYGDKIKFTKLNTTKARRLAISQRVLGLPTIILYKDGEKIEELTKDHAKKEKIDEILNKYVG